MVLKGLIQKYRMERFPESSGYYERIPIRVGEFTLVQNEKDKIVFETTHQSFCGNGGKIKVQIIASEDKKWSVRKVQDGIGGSITPGVSLATEKTARRRAMWHAAQYMSGNNLNSRQRFTTMHQVSNEKSADLFEDDAFFRQGECITNDPFGDFLEK